MADWADHGNEFLVFLEAYGHISKTNELDTNVISESRINALWSSHKNRFNAWLKCPELLRKKHFNKIPDYILDIAEKDPNFTEADALKAEEEYQNKQNPYSFVPDDLAKHPAYEQLCTCGVKFTLAHIASMKLMSETYLRGGYSYQNAQKVGSEYAIRGALLSKRAETEANSNLSDAEKIKLLEIIDKQHFSSRQRELESKEAEINKRHPERAIIRLLWKMQKDSLNSKEVADQIHHHIQTIKDNDTLVLLAERMANAKYQGLQQTTKAFFADILDANGIDISHLNQISEDFMPKDVQKSQSLQQSPKILTTIQQQKYGQIRYSR